jgi:hypothetical protein
VITTEIAILQTMRTHIFIYCIDSDKIISHIIGRLRLCREVECVNVCWENDPDRKLLIIKPFLGSSFEIRYDNAKKGEKERTNVRIEKKSSSHGYGEFNKEKTRIFKVSDLCSDNKPAVDELYGMIHHMFLKSMCKLKNTNAQSPMMRLEKLEALVEDLTKASGMADPGYQSSKRQKLLK